MDNEAVEKHQSPSLFCVAKIAILRETGNKYKNNKKKQKVFTVNKNRKNE